VLALKGFGAFWWDFIVGDDWRIAVGIVVALTATALVATTSVPAWWIMPVAVAALLGLSLWEAVRHDSNR
jgi:predicted ABC-type sugar transport system permease subunit